MGEEKQSNPKYYNYFNALQAFCGGDEVPHTILCRSTKKSYLIGYNSIFCAVNTLSDLFRSAVICYSVVGSVVGRYRSSWHF